jgi:ATP-dependent Clp protease ATP-binding subunit ClpA
MIAQELESTLHNAFIDARSKRHEFVTVEHLLLALLDDYAVADALRACRANLDWLREQLTAHTAQHTPIVADDRDLNTQPTLGFQRTIERAILHTQSAGKKQVSSTDVLVAIFGENESHAVYFLDEQGVDRLQVTRYVSHGASAVLPEDLDARDMRQIILFQDQAVPAEMTATVLEDFLLLGKEELAEVLSELARAGKALCGLYPRETAELVVSQIRAYAVKHRLSLRCEAPPQPSRPPGEQE